MKQQKVGFICKECGNETSRWSGQCPACGAWNSLEEFHGLKAASSGKIQKRVYEAPQSIQEITTDQDIRFPSSMKEFDRTLGGGIVKGSIVLLAGDPGIGKSTLLMQIGDDLAKRYSVLYVSGEESASQLKLRAERLGVKAGGLKLLIENQLERIQAVIVQDKPDFVVIDSIQTTRSEEISTMPGSVTQVRECTNQLAQTAKSEGIPIILVGHVNKDGNIAGPKVLEHIVDAVLTFEGDRSSSFRILRAAKNRYGSTNELAVFDMQRQGLTEVENPSAALLSERPLGVSGSCVCSAIEGSRPIMAEVQALVTKTGFGVPRRVSTGLDYNRMAMIMAVLEKRAGYSFSALDAYINLVGGLRLDEPAVDLAVALALISGCRDLPLDSDVVAFGELGLGGEIRSVQGIEKRIFEAQKLGFRRCIFPYQRKQDMENLQKGSIELMPVKSIAQAIAAAFPNQK